MAQRRDKGQAQANLQVHQASQTKFPTLCEDITKSGIVYWIIDLEVMTCTYYDQND
ncbi:DUF1398 family protein [Streptococcus thoraltensis]